MVGRGRAKTVLFLSTKKILAQIFAKRLKIIHASGLSLNTNNCELLPLKTCNVPLISSIPVKDAVTYPGLTINKNQDTRSSLNFNPIVDKVQKRFCSWLQRDFEGRILVSKAEGISHLIYAL